MKKIILGLDPGIADTGYGVIEVDKGKFSCIDFGSIKTSPQDCFIDRLEILDNKLQEIIEKYKPSIASVEKLFFNTNAKTALIVGQARGVVLLNIKKNNLKLIELTPLQIKQGVTNFGRADKSQVKKMVKIILGLQELPGSDDSADALAAAICASGYLEI
jgi:crossover junction endodeoxyribonuclease RuvC